MSGKTDGRRAYDAWWATAEGVPRHPDVTYDQDGAAWEAAAAAGAATVRERVAQLVSEANELRALLDEILADCPGCGFWHGPPTGRDQVARWRKRMVTPAVATSGTGHLAKLIGDAANADEAP